MPGGTGSNGTGPTTTGIGEFPSLVLGIATRYRIFFRFGFGSDIGEFSSLVLGTACCSLPVPFSLMPSVASTSCWQGCCDEALFNFLQEQF